MLALGLRAVDAYVLGLSTQHIIGNAVADGIKVADLPDFPRHRGGIVKLFLGANRARTLVPPRSARIVVIDRFHAVVVIVATCSRLAVRQQDRILIAWGNVLSGSSKAQIVAGQHQAGFQVGGALGLQSVNRIFDSFQALLRADIDPPADSLGRRHFLASAETDHRDPDSATGSISGQQIRQETSLVVIDGCLCGVQTGLPGFLIRAVFLVILLAHVRTANRAESHGTRGINDQLHRRVTGFHLLCGLHRQGDVKRVHAGLPNGLAEGEALTLGRAGFDLVAAGIKPARHDLILAGLGLIYGKCRDLHQAQAHDQGHEQAQCPLADRLAPGDSLAGIVFACHDSFPP